MTSLSQSSTEVCNSSRIILLYIQLQHLSVERIKMYTEYLIAIKHAVMLTYILGETGLHILFVRRAAVIFFFYMDKRRDCFVHLIRHESMYNMADHLEIQA